MRTPTIPPLLVQALVSERAGTWRPDPGIRVEVEVGEGWRHGRYASGGGPDVELWRVVAGAEAPLSWPAGAPFLPGLSCSAAREGELLSLTWPDEEFAGRPDGLSGGRGTPAAVGDRPTPAVVAALVEGLERLVEAARRDGWTVRSDEALDAVIRGRVVRWTRRGRERAVSLTESLGVVQLTLIEAPEPATSA